MSAEKRSVELQLEPSQRPFKQVDVFTSKPYFGNALAVVLNGSGLSDEQMQRFAMWTNLAETTFLMSPTPEAADAGADYQVRIFTTAYEMSFAGHPTLGSCHAWLASGGVPKDPTCIVQQCNLGLVKIQRQGTRLAFAAPTLQRSVISADVLPGLLSALGLSAGQVVASQHLVNGPKFFGILLDSVHTVLELAPDFAALKAVLALGSCSGVGVASKYTAPLNGFEVVDSSSGIASAKAVDSTSCIASDTSANSDSQTHSVNGEPSFEVRMFVSDLEVTEDPITGSFNASLAQWLIAEDRAPHSYVAAQGTCIGRKGRVYIDQDASGQVWVGGDSVTCVDGSVLL